jgi:hypothetical protein
MKPKTTIPYYHTKHGPEIFPRRRTFTPDEMRWRKATVSFWGYFAQIRDKFHLLPWWAREAVWLQTYVGVLNNA